METLMYTYTQYTDIKQSHNDTGMKYAYSQIWECVQERTVEKSIEGATRGLR